MRRLSESLILPYGALLDSKLTLGYNLSSQPSVTGLKEQVEKHDMQKAHKALMKDECVGPRWQRETQSFRDLVLEFKKIRQMIPEGRHRSADETLSQIQERLDNWGKTFANVVRVKFVQGFEQLAAKLDKAIQNQDGSSTIVAFNQLSRKIKGVTLKGLFTTTEMEKMSEDVYNKRVACIDALQKGTTAIFGMKNITHEHKDFDATQGALHAFGVELADMKIDAEVFAGEGGLPPWKDSASRAALVSMRTRFHRVLAGYYKNTLSQSLGDKHSRTCAEILSQMLSSVEALDPNSETYADHVKDICKRVIEGALDQHRPSSSVKNASAIWHQSWRLAAVSLLSLDSDTLQPTVETVECAAAVEDANQTNLDLKVNLVLILHDFVAVFDNVCKVKQIANAINAAQGSAAKINVMMAGDTFPTIGTSLQKLSALGQSLYEAKTVRHHHQRYLDVVEELGHAIRHVVWEATNKTAAALVSELEESHRDLEVQYGVLEEHVEKADELNETFRESLMKDLINHEEVSAFKTSYKNFSINCLIPGQFLARASKFLGPFRAKLEVNLDSWLEESKSGAEIDHEYSVYVIVQQSMEKISGKDGERDTALENARAHVSVVRSEAKGLTKPRIKQLLDGKIKFA